MIKFAKTEVYMERIKLTKEERLLLNGVKSACLTMKGKAYLAVNPKLRNPFPWDTIMKAATLIAAVAATAALFISSCRLLMMR